MSSDDDRYRGTGWAWGSTDGGEWLTIAGSALYTTRLAAHPEDAVPPAPIIGSTQVLARVERHGTWFRVIELAAEPDRHRLITAPRSRLSGLVTGWCTCASWTYDPKLWRSVFADGWQFDGEAPRAEVEAAYAREHGAR